MDKSDAGFVCQWKKTGFALDAVLTEELKRVDVSRSMQILSDAYEHALRVSPRRTDSGLVEQQKHFRRGLTHGEASGSCG